MGVTVTPTCDDAAMDVLTISCDDCRMQHTSACEGCVVTFICDRSPTEAVVIDVEEVRALRLLGRSGLVPPLRHERFGNLECG
jgi:hypothetical protein